MPTYQLMNRRNYQPGDHGFGPATLDDGLSNIVVEIDRTDWDDPAVTIGLASELSFDGGQSWELFNSITAIGGQMFDPDTGLPEDVTSFETVLPDGTGRQVRGTVTIGGGAVRIQATVTIS